MKGETIDLTAGRENGQVLERAPTQEAFHIETMREMIATHHRMFKGDTRTACLPLGLFETHEDAFEYMMDRIRGETGRQSPVY